MIATTTKLTFDIDDGRKNYCPFIIADNSGRQILFYEKHLKSGLTAYSFVASHIILSLPFFITVPVGSGTLNGTFVSWVLMIVSATANTFKLVYVYLAGVVYITFDFPMTFLKNSIMSVCEYRGQCYCPSKRD